MILYTLNTGVKVLAREVKRPDGIFVYPFTYMSHAQASAKAQTIGGSVIRGTRSFYVIPAQGAQP